MGRETQKGIADRAQDADHVTDEGAKSTAATESADRKAAGDGAADAAARRMAAQGNGQLPLCVADDPNYHHAMQVVEQAAKTQAGGAKTAGEPKKDGDAGDKGGPKKEEMTGIGSSLAVGRFVAEAKKVQAGWDKLKPEERADTLGKAANTELKAVSVPEVANKIEDLGQNAGQLHFRDWTLGLGKAPFSQAKVTDAEAADMADTVYHESRHAEQWHRMARLLAGKGKKPAEIHKDTDIPETVCEDAKNKPIDLGKPEGKEAQSFYDSVYGTSSEHRGTVLTNLRTQGAARRTAEESYNKLAADKSTKPDDLKKAKDAWDKAVTDFNATYKQYTELPEEADAWKVGGAVTSAYLAKK